MSAEGGRFDGELGAVWRGEVDAITTLGARSQVDRREVEVLDPVGVALAPFDWGHETTRGQDRVDGGREAEDVDDDDHVRAGAEAGEAGRAPLETGAKPALELGVAQGSGRSAIRFRTCERWPISWAAMRRQKSRMSISPSRSSVNL